LSISLLCSTVRRSGLFLYLPAVAPNKQFCFLLEEKILRNPKSGTLFLLRNLCVRDSIDKWDFIKLKSFCSSKEMVSKLKRTPTEWEKIFASYTSKD
jgi:hypothetical protein